MGRCFDPGAVLGLPLVASLATVEEGAPRVAPVWFLWEAGALWIPASTASSSVRRIRAESRCAVEIVRFEPEAGILLHLGLRGRASVEPMNAGRFRRLLAKYLGADEAAWNAWFVAEIARIDDPRGRLIRVAPDSVFTNDVSYFLTGPDYATP